MNRNHPALSQPPRLCTSKAWRFFRNCRESARGAWLLAAARGTEDTVFRRGHRGRSAEGRRDRPTRGAKGHPASTASGLEPIEAQGRRAHAELKAIAAQKKLELPIEPRPEHKATIAELRDGVGEGLRPRLPACVMADACADALDLFHPGSELWGDPNVKASGREGDPGPEENLAESTSSRSRRPRRALLRTESPRRACRRRSNCGVRRRDPSSQVEPAMMAPGRYPDGLLRMWGGQQILGNTRFHGDVLLRGRSVTTGHDAFLDQVGPALESNLFSTAEQQVAVPRPLPVLVSGKQVAVPGLEPGSGMALRRSMLLVGGLATGVFCGASSCYSMPDVWVKAVLGTPMKNPPPSRGIAWLGGFQECPTCRASMAAAGPGSLSISSPRGSWSSMAFGALRRLRVPRRQLVTGRQGRLSLEPHLLGVGLGSQGQLGGQEAVRLGIAVSRPVRGRRPRGGSRRAAPRPPAVHVASLLLVHEEQVAPPSRPAMSMFCGFRCTRRCRGGGAALRPRS